MGSLGSSHIITSIHIPSIKPTQVFWSYKVPCPAAVISHAVAVCLIVWISDTCRQGYTELQSLVKCLDRRDIVSVTVCSQARLGRAVDVCSCFIPPVLSHYTSWKVSECFWGAYLHTFVTSTTNQLISIAWLCRLVTCLASRDTCTQEVGMRMQIGQRHFNAHAFVNMAILLDVHETGSDGHKGLQIKSAHVTFGFDQLKGTELHCHLLPFIFLFFSLFSHITDLWTSPRQPGRFRTCSKLFTCAGETRQGGEPESKLPSLSPCM